MEKVQNLKKVVDSIPDSNGNNGIELCRKALGYDSKLIQPMFRSLLPYFKIQIQICNFICCIPYYWDEKEEKVGIVKSKISMWIYKMQIYLHSAYALLMVGYFLRTTKLNKTETMLLGSIFLSVLVATILLRIAYVMNLKEGALLWNSLLEFERKFLPKPDRDKRVDPIAKIMILLGIATCFGLPLFMSTILLVDPCKPPHLGYILYKKSLTECVKPEWPIRVCLLIFDTFVWGMAITPCCLYSFNAFFLGLKSMDQYLQLLQKCNDSPLGKSFQNDGQKNEISFELYRQLEILGKLYNYLLQSLFLPTIVAIAIFVIIIGLYACIKLHGVIPMPGFAFFPLISCNGFSVIFTTKVAAVVFIQSKRYLTSRRKTVKHRRKDWYRKVAKSLDFVKIKFGNNFIDEKTPLVFLDFCINQTVSLMLLID